MSFLCIKVFLVESYSIYDRNCVSKSKLERDQSILFIFFLLKYYSLSKTYYTALKSVEYLLKKYQLPITGDIDACSSSYGPERKHYQGSFQSMVWMIFSSRNKNIVRILSDLSPFMCFVRSRWDGVKVPMCETSDSMDTGCWCCGRVTWHLVHSLIMASDESDCC